MNMTKIAACGCLAVLGCVAMARAEIISNTAFHIDFVQDKHAAKKATWSDPQHFNFTAEGLGWGMAVDEKVSRDFWLETQPIAIGLAWRPTCIAGVRVMLEQPGSAGELYVRYSPDLKHWSTWQVLKRETTPRAKEGVHAFEGQARVTYRDRAQYDVLRLRYARREEVAWSSDEDALARELVKHDPKFFEKSLPFVGYVQFLYEKSLPSGQRIKSIDVRVDWQTSGIQTEPRDPKTYKEKRGPWQFKAP